MESNNNMDLTTVSTLSDFVSTSSFKKFSYNMNNWGKMLAIIGALMMLYHVNAGKIILTIGGGIIAVFYFFTAFHPLHEELDWTLVFPQLAGMKVDDSADMNESPDLTVLRPQIIPELKKEIEKLKIEIEMLKNK
jgi:gliding motility-associated protein GldL